MRNKGSNYRPKDTREPNFSVTTATGNGYADNLITDQQLRVAQRDIRNMTTAAGNALNRVASKIDRGSSQDMQRKGYFNPTASGSGQNSGRGGKMDREWKNHRWVSRERNSEGKWIYNYGDEGQNEKSSNNSLASNAAKVAIRLNKLMGKNVLTQKPKLKLSHNPIDTEKSTPYYVAKQSNKLGEEWLKDLVKG